MTGSPFTIEDLRSILRSAAGEGLGYSLDADILDVSFEELGYDSIAMLETVSRIERKMSVALGDSLAMDAVTPRALIAAVNEQLAD